MSVRLKHSISMADRKPALCKANNTQFFSCILKWNECGIWCWNRESGVIFLNAGQHWKKCIASILFVIKRLVSEFEIFTYIFTYLISPLNIIKNLLKKLDERFASFKQNGKICLWNLYWRWYNMWPFRQEKSISLISCSPAYAVEKHNYIVYKLVQDII